MFAGAVFNFGRQKEFGEQLLEGEIEKLKEQLAFEIPEKVFKKKISNLQEGVLYSSILCGKKPPVNIWRDALVELENYVDNLPNPKKYLDVLEEAKNEFRKEAKLPSSSKKMHSDRLSSAGSGKSSSILSMLNSFGKWVLGNPRQAVTAFLLAKVAFASANLQKDSNSSEIGSGILTFPSGRELIPQNNLNVLSRKLLFFSTAPVTVSADITSEYSLGTVRNKIRELKEKIEELKEEARPNKALLLQISNFESQVIRFKKYVENLVKRFSQRVSKLKDNNSKSLNRINTMKREIKDLRLTLLTEEKAENEFIKEAKPHIVPRKVRDLTTWPVIAVDISEWSTEDAVRELGEEVEKLRGEVEKLRREAQLGRIALQPINDFDNIITKLKVYVDNSIKQFSQRISELEDNNLELRNQIGKMEKKIEDLYSMSLPREVVRDIESRDFESAERNLKSIKNDKRINFIVHKVYSNDIANFNLVLQLGNSIKNISRSFLIYEALNWEMEINGHNNARTVKTLAKTLENRFINITDVPNHLKSDAAFLISELSSRLSTNSIHCSHLANQSGDISVRDEYNNTQFHYNVISKACGLEVLMRQRETYYLMEAWSTLEQVFNPIITEKEYNITQGCLNLGYPLEAPNFNHEIRELEEIIGMDNISVKDRSLAVMLHYVETLCQNSLVQSTSELEQLTLKMPNDDMIKGYFMVHFVEHLTEKKVDWEYLKNVASVEFVNKWNQTLAHFAAGKGRADIIVELRKYGFDVHAKDVWGFSPLHYARRRGHVNVEQELIYGRVNINVKNKLDKIPQGFIHTMERDDFIQESDPPITFLYPGQLLVIAFILCIMYKILNYENIIEITDERGATLLHYAARAGKTIIIEELKRQGAKLEVRDLDGRTPLYYAAMNNELNAVKKLVEMGAKIDTQDLDIASKSQHKGIVEYLRSKMEVNPPSILHNTTVVAMPGRGR